MDRSGLLASKKYVLFVVTFGLFADVLSYSIVIPLTPFIFTRLNIGNPSDAQENSALVGALLASYAAAQLVSCPIFGWVSDRITNRKWPMIWGLFAGMVAIIMFAAATNFTMLVIARILQGVSAAAVWTLGFALLGDVYPDEELGTAFGTAMAGFSIGTVFGLPIGGALYQFAGYWTPFIVSAVFIVIDMIARFLVVEKSHGVASSALNSADTIDETAADSMATLALTTEQCRPPPRKALLRTLTWNSLRVPSPSYVDMARDPAIFMLNAVSAIIGTVLMAYEPTLPLYLEKEFGAQSGTVGLIFLAIVSAGLFSGPAAGALRDKFGATVVIIPSLLAVAVVAPMMAVAKSYATLAVVSFLLGFFVIAIQAPIMSELIPLAPPSATGKLVAFNNIAYSIGMLVGPIAAGAIYQVSSFLTMSCVLSGLSALQVAMYWVFVVLKQDRETVKKELEKARGSAVEGSDGEAKVHA
ncbi:MFS general substrate transporter [Gonapodya prolifera JEL478]|uniref:MFS general substrate transporter n=1 Tax=Gonapodya prolifera (strain JEL478) TaxID=1344416 RepID=A0A139A0I1_GONPJ|nr:MFS general substrate transporter [Gonapodya prolifera JEL478]|eukprot:KXS10242.1 MFS general substrate transporter [Gonapodya prolifera JEL478]